MHEALLKRHVWKIGISIRQETRMWLKLKLARPADGVIAANDFSGKLLEEAAGSGDWPEGMRFASGASEEDVKKWLEEPGP